MTGDRPLGSRTSNQHSQRLHPRKTHGSDHHLPRSARPAFPAGSTQKPHPAIGTGTRPTTTIHKGTLSKHPHHIRSLSSVLKGRHRA